ncbi:hypothetical protein FOCC_FOCC015154 [Frankliniella occidentalis]|nr:hypothetical protein FOCC_FOCC015154 [Frankliniella occidentalis]
MTINFHLVLHLCDVVSEKGPLWTTSCFPHEGVNGQILKLIHGPRYPEMQVASSVQMVLNQQEMIHNLIPGPAKQFCEETLSTTNNRTQFCYGENVIVGKWHKIQKPLKYLENVALQDGEYITQFHCLRRKKMTYVAESYNRGNKRDSSAVTYEQEDEEKVGLVKTFIRSSKCQCTACDCPCTLFAVIQSLKIVGLFDTLIPDIPVPNTKEYMREENFKLVPVHSLTSVSVKMELDSGLYISKRCNKYNEKEASPQIDLEKETAT